MHAVSLPWFGSAIKVGDEVGRAIGGQQDAVADTRELQAERGRQCGPDRVRICRRGDRVELTQSVSTGTSLVAGVSDGAPSIGHVHGRTDLQQRVAVTLLVGQEMELAGHPLEGIVGGARLVLGAVDGVKQR